MFTVDIKVNGILVGHLHCHNRMLPDEDFLDTYKYTYVQVDKPNGYGGIVSHRASNGIEKLVSKILDDVSKKVAPRNKS